MLFRLQNIDSPGVIWKIFRNKGLAVANRLESGRGFSRKFYLHGYYFDGMRLHFTDSSSHLGHRQAIVPRLAEKSQAFRGWNPSRRVRGCDICGAPGACMGVTFVEHEVLRF